MSVERVLWYFYSFLADTFSRSALIYVIIVMLTFIIFINALDLIASFADFILNRKKG
jgi:hypothetical protein